MVKKVITKVFGVSKHAFFYYYDRNGNINHVEENYDPYSIDGYDVGASIEYHYYDGMNQLIREDNRMLNTTVLYTYDTAGNILTKKTYVFDPATPTNLLDEKIYTYSTEGWKDRLTALNGQAITYDALGNPTNYLGHDLTWDRVRQLSKFDDVTFRYDSSGRRNHKNNYLYVYEGDQFIRERRNGEEFIFFRDATGICGFKHDIYSGGIERQDIYYFQKNLQGDVMSIYDATGTKVAEYLYDAWGKCTIRSDSTGIGALNPIRYRGYYYDTETGLYYLNSRYYDPNTGRFINADVGITTKRGILGYNLYSYCLNNPISFEDKEGTYADAAGWWGATMWWLCGADAVLPVGDMIYFGVFAALGIIGVGVAENISSIEIDDSNANSKSSAKEEEKDISITKTKKQAYFSINPYNFKPNGLVRTVYSGTKNGKIIKWSDPITMVTIFEWNEDLANGPHYHVLLPEWNSRHLGVHYLPGTPVPEPWNTLYFGG